jgi:hypothetical protein
MILALLLTMAVGFPIFAEGVQEQEEGTVTPRPLDPSYQIERITVTGNLQLTAARPVLKSDGREYELLYPLHLARGLEVTDGERITVRGFLVPGPRWAWTGEDERHLRVELVKIDGREYDLRGWYGHGPGYGPGRGGMMHGGRGGRGGWGGYGHRGGPGYDRSW